MPKQRITREMVAEAAFSITRAEGADAATVKRVAERLGCSVQPIYTYCDSAVGLRREVEALTRAFVARFVAERTRGDDLFRETGMAFLALAREEPHLFRVFITQTREGVDSLDALYRTQCSPLVAPAAARALGIREEAARALHLHMVIYTMGIGAILTTASPGIPMEQITAQVEEAYQALAAWAKKKEDCTR